MILERQGSLEVTHDEKIKNEKIEIKFKKKNVYFSKEKKTEDKSAFWSYYLKWKFHIYTQKIKVYFYNC